MLLACGTISLSTSTHIFFNYRVYAIPISFFCWSPSLMRLISIMKNRVIRTCFPWKVGHWDWIFLHCSQCRGHFVYLYQVPASNHCVLACYCYVWPYWRCACITTYGCITHSSVRLRQLRRVSVGRGWIYAFLGWVTGGLGQEQVLLIMEVFDIEELARSVVRQSV